MPKNNKGERNKRGSGTRMKREYVKPVIESEEFVANEYVAACWIIKCKKTGETFVQKTDPSWDAWDSDNDGFGQEKYFSVKGDYIYRGDRFDHDGENTPLDLGLISAYHEVTFEQTNAKNNPNHPNASA